MAVISDFVSFRVRLILDFAILFFFFFSALVRYCMVAVSFLRTIHILRAPLTEEASITNNLLVQTIFYLIRIQGYTWDFLSFISL